MNTKRHIILFVIVLIAWITFYLIGLPSDYFTQWKTSEKILLSLVTFFGIVPFLSFVTLVLLGGDYFRTSIWFAFYASIVIFIFDFIAVGIIEQKGISYIISHWPLSIAYLYVWIEIPIIGLVIKQIFTDNTQKNI